jgi:hypothetical protein
MQSTQRNRASRHEETSHETHSDQAIKAGGGKAELKTVNGETLTLPENEPHNIVVTDAAGHTADIVMLGFPRPIA